MGLRRSRKGFDSRVQVAVTPFLDFAFQLLAFFVVMGSSPLRPEGELDLALPTEKPVVAKDQNRADILNQNIGDVDDAEPPADITVLVTTIPDEKKSGPIQGIFLIFKEDPLQTRHPVLAQGWDAKNIKPLMQELQDRLKAERETHNSKQEIIMLADRKLKWEYVVKVRDACEKAGYSKANFKRQ